MSLQLRLLVIGLDGATFEIINPMMAEGRLPAIARLMASGASGPLCSTVPPVSAPAWSTFMTGLNPGKHGIFQWRTYDPSKYTCLDERLMTSSRLVGRAFWDVMGDAGYRVGVVTVPMTYPPWPVNGFMVSGYPCPDTDRNYGYPASWASGLADPYNFSADFYGQASEEEVWKSGLEMLSRRTTLAADLIKQEHLDVCVVVLGEIDRAQHDFWKYSDPAFPAYHTARGEHFRGVIAEHYAVCDAQVERLLHLADQDTLVVVVSDHGGGRHPPRLFHTNAWLRSLGWLRPAGGRSSSVNALLRSVVGFARRQLPIEERLRRVLPASLVNGVRQFSLNIADVEWPNTRAYRFPMYHPIEGIEINLRGRQPQGTVEPGGEHDRLREEIIAALEAARDPEDSSPIASKVWRREELYSGPFATLAPDIAFMTSPQFRADSGLRGPFVCASPLPQLEQFSGLHTMEGVFIASGTGVRTGHEVLGMQIADVAPTLLYALDCAIGEDVDGQVREDIFTVQSRESRARRCQGPPRAPLGGVRSLTNEEEDQMRAKLRALGYLE